MAEHKLRNRIIASAVYALLSGGTVYGYIRSTGLEAEVSEAAVADSARADSIVGLIVKRDSLLDVLAIPPDTVVLEKIVRIYVPPDTVFQLDTLPAITVTDTVTISLVDTLRIPVVQVDTLYRIIREPDDLLAAILGLTGIVFGASWAYQAVR